MSRFKKGDYEAYLTHVTGAGHPSTLGGIEFGQELGDARDLFRVGNNDSSLGAPVSYLREGFRACRHRLRGGHTGP